MGWPFPYDTWTELFELSSEKLQHAVLESVGGSPNPEITEHHAASKWKIKSSKGSNWWKYLNPKLLSSMFHFESKTLESRAFQFPTYFSCWPIIGSPCYLRHLWGVASSSIYGGIAQEGSASRELSPRLLASTRETTVVKYCRWCESKNKQISPNLDPFSRYLILPSLNTTNFTPATVWGHDQWPCLRTPERIGQWVLRCCMGGRVVVAQAYQFTGPVILTI